MTIEGLPASLEMKDSNGDVQEIERLDPDNAQRTLGVGKCPAGSNKAEKEYLKQMANQWKKEIRTGRLDRRDVWADLMT